MRDIKFRGKRKDNSKWIVGNLVRQMTKHYMISVGDFDDILSDIELLFNRCWAEVDENTIGQFTGIYDKNGKEIYEGDIIKLFGDKEYIGVIKYDLASFVIDTGKICTYLGDIDIEEQFVEVIGNIYDNKNLLEG